MNSVLGRHPAAMMAPSFVHTMPFASVTVPPAAAAKVGAVTPLVPATPVFICKLLFASKTYANGA